MTAALDLIRAVAAAAPDRVAIEDAAGDGVTYGELIARVDRAAGEVARGAVVEVAAERSVAFVVGCLAAWAAGAAWFPVDQREPAWRRDAMRAALVGVDGDGLAYVIATSGSSGAPKLVLVEHGGIRALLTAQIAAFELGPGVRSLWLHAPRFDASLSDWGTALASGATLVLPRPDALARLRDELAERAIAYVDLPPALLGPLGEPPPGLRVVVLGGEPCPIEPLCALARRLKVVVVYGPTEATVCSSLVAVDAARWTRPLIGAPLPGVAYRVVDGELWIGGACLARGYAGDADATARQFVVDDGLRWYRTGDRVEACDGGLAFVGRIDRQRKLAGVRIELDEVEAVLRRAPGVREAAAAVRPIGAGRPRLIAFVDGDALEVGALRAWLAREAPPWMMPARIIAGALPRTATGKVDHGALASQALPAVAGTVSRSLEIERAGDPLRARLAALWCEALDIADMSEIAADLRFRDAGGDSLAQLTLRAAAAANGIALPAEALAVDPTFDELVTAAREARPAPITVAMCEARGQAALDARGFASQGFGRRDGAVLLTGASGQLGRALLAAWRTMDPVRPIFALVRAPDRAAARRRLGALADRVEVVCGDVTRPELGLTPAFWREIAVWGATIVHAAAHIELGAGWDAHAATNVDGTAEVARVAAAHRLSWHHVSTLSVFVSTDRATGVHRETDVPAGDAIAYGGYAQTKIAAEAIARTASASTMLRLGLLVGAAPRPGDQLAMIVRGLARLGAVPAGAGALRFDVTPLDHAATAIVALIEHAPRYLDVHHIASATGASFAELIAAIAAEGVTLAELPPEAWAARARARLGDPDIAMAYLALGRAHGGHVDPAYDLFLATGAEFDVARTAARLAAHRIVVPPVAFTLAALVAAALGGPA